MPHNVSTIANHFSLSTPPNPAILKPMKKETHPTYYPKAKATCGCGNIFTVGPTQAEIKVEICNKCHPFYTGAQTLIDTAGRVERFKARKAQAKPESVAKQKAKKSAKHESISKKKTKK